jgi:hypothetical protein
MGLPALVWACSADGLKLGARPIGSAPADSTPFDFNGSLSMLRLLIASKPKHLPVGSAPRLRCSGERIRSDDEKIRSDDEIIRCSFR